MFQDTLSKVRDEVEATQSASDRFSNILGFGDFSLRNIIWPEGGTPNGNGIETRQARSLLSFMNTHFMTQMCEEPTHEQSCLDLVLTNNVKLIHSIRIEKNDFSFSDHNTIKVFMTTGPGKKEKVDVSRDFYTTIINRYNLRDATEDDWGKYLAILSKINWAKETQHFSASQKVEFLAKCMEDAVVKVFPLKSEMRTGYKIPKHIKKKMRCRSQLGKYMITTLVPDSFLKY